MKELLNLTCAEMDDNANNDPSEAGLDLPPPRLPSRPPPQAAIEGTATSETDLTSAAVPDGVVSSSCRVAQRPQSSLVIEAWLRKKTPQLLETTWLAYAQKMMNYGIDTIPCLLSLLSLPKEDVEEIMTNEIGMKPFHFALFLRALERHWKKNQRRKGPSTSST